MRLHPLVGLGAVGPGADRSGRLLVEQFGQRHAPFKVSGTAVRTDRVDLPKTYKFAPAVIEVKAGTTVTWTNHDDFPHNVTLVTGPDKTSRSLAIGESATIPFNQVGTVFYECTLHPQQMRGKVIVT